MKLDQNGFTLLELMVTVGILGMIVVTVTGLFFRAVRGGSKTDTVVTLDQNAQLAMTIMGQFIRNAKEVVSVEGMECPANGSSITLTGWDGGVTTFALADGRLASNGGMISESIVEISNLNFDCVRLDGVPDQVVVTFDATRLDTGGGAETNASYESVVNLRNY